MSFTYIELRVCARHHGEQLQAFIHKVINSRSRYSDYSRSRNEGTGAPRNETVPCSQAQLGKAEWDSSPRVSGFESLLLTCYLQREQPFFALFSWFSMEELCCQKITHQI